jgi:Glycosyl hydrolase family 59
MRWYRSSRKVRTSAIAFILAGGTLALYSVAPATAAQTPAAQKTQITINGRDYGRVFSGIGAISGGGANARLLIDYPPRQRTQILNYLFGPGGADLQMLKLEIGDDTAPSDGAEPSIIHTKGQAPDCNSGYEWWLAEQAAARNPNIQLMALQWGAPGWIGNIYGQNDISYVIDWLNCAKSHDLTIDYLGGWDEHALNVAWYESMRKALNANGYSNVKLMAADSFPGKSYDWQRTFQVAAVAAKNPKFKASIGVIAVHDTCGGPTRGYQCESTATAKNLGLPLWESELGTLHGSTSAASMARTINNGYNQADMTGFVEWPLVSAMSPGLLYEGRGMVVADEPQSGFYYVNRISWAIAQTTQFVQPRWRHVAGADGSLGATGTYDAYVAPDGKDWSLVTENTGHKGGEKLTSQTITVHLTGGLKTGSVSVWSTNLNSARPSTWFVHRKYVHPSHGTFTYTIPAGYAVSFTSTSGQSHLTPPAAPANTPQHLPYTATPDLSNEATDLGTQEGAFLYEPCQGGVGGQCLEQLAGPNPIWWQKPGSGTPEPYAITGSTNWSGYTVSSSVLIPTASASASLIGRYSDQVYGLPDEFDGYVFKLTGNGTWQLIRNNAGPKATALKSGQVPGIVPGTWQSISLRLNGTVISASVNGMVVASVKDPAYKTGLAGISSTWSPVQFNNLGVH